MLLVKLWRRVNASSPAVWLRATPPRFASREVPVSRAVWQSRSGPPPPQWYFCQRGHAHDVAEHGSCLPPPQLSFTWTRECRVPVPNSVYRVYTRCVVLRAVKIWMLLSRRELND